jgi:FkbM family methyltransferase
MTQYIQRHGYWWYNGPEAVENLPTGPHEQDIIVFLEQFLPKTPKGLFIDVGAHYGLYTIQLAKHFEKVWAFEPHPRNFEILLRNIRANQLGNITPYRLALWDRDGEVGLLLGEGNDPNKISGRFKATDEKSELRAQSARLDTLAPEDVAFIKIDVEGGGHRVLMGAVKTLQKYRPTVQIEYHSKEEMEWCGKILYMFGYGEYKRFPYPPYYLSIMVARPT